MTKTPNYKLSDRIVFNGAGAMHNTIELEAGYFVRPINIEYVPQHVLDDPRWRWRDEESDVFVYTHFGILLIPKKFLREV